MGFSQGILASLVADTSPAPLRGTAFGVFNLVCGVCLLLASVLAGALWQRWGAQSTFLAGAGCALLALVVLLCHAGTTAGQARITSYNVCYTKLLRIP